MTRSIRVHGARQHNLKGIDVEIPRRALTVLTGPSGSGKSSLAFDTIYAEGQRRYIESLSTYAKQFMEQLEKPAVEWIEGVSPSVAIDQKNNVQTSRSTVATSTEVYDYMRLLWARVGRTICPDCGIRIQPDTVQSATDEVLELDGGTRLLVVFDLPLSGEISHSVAVSNLKQQGYLRVIADGELWHLEDLPQPESEESGEEDDEDDEEEGGAGEGARDEAPAAGGELPGGAPDLAEADELLVVVDRLTVDPEERERLADSLAAAFAEGEGDADVLAVGRSAGREVEVEERLSFTETFRCPECGRRFPEPAPSTFSFNSPAGACEECNGFGATLEYDLELIVPNPDRTLEDGALDPWTMPRYDGYRRRLREFAARRGIPTDVPWRELSGEAREELLHGSDDFVGMLPFLESRESKKYKRYIRVFLRKYQKPMMCTECGGDRLKPEALNVHLGGLTISEAARLSIAEFRQWLGGLELEPFERKVAETILEELADRIRFLDEVGLGYLTLDRQARTLSGGEMQRIRLATCLGSNLVETLYVLDEPTIGLHARDVTRFLSVLSRLRNLGNTVLVVEHDPAALRMADHVVELGPGSGERGGEVVFEGEFSELLEADTTTGEHLAERGGEVKSEPRAGTGGALRLRGASLHNVEDLDAEVPLGTLTVVSGVSGSGKSTLVHDLLYHAMEEHLTGETSAKEHLGQETGSYGALEGAAAVDDVVLVDQSPVGRTPRSNPVTYIKAFGEIRKLFAGQPLARRRGYDKGHFSFNTSGGRCDACKGSGVKEVEMVFMADVQVPCDRCGGARYTPEVLDVEYRGKSIRDVLDLTVDEAIRFFIRQDRLGEKLWQLQRVGLGYLRLGQPANTLSGGEAQRLKVARELAQASGDQDHRLYILDEPTVGLGLAEVERLVDVLDELVDAGNTVLVVEHNLDVIARADWVLDMGPGPADEGGDIVVAGPPKRVMEEDASHTGDFLRRYREATEAAPRADLAAETAPASA
ncbi:MAG: excinuclease ABC subunit UvrA [Candidatus Palauibacterales bacterium]|nr:excinuclease ABC subunit UvrA [Candidatus Palauibacterales bacterium]